MMRSAVSGGTWRLTKIKVFVGGDLAIQLAHGHIQQTCQLLLLYQRHDPRVARESPRSTSSA
jgi:hypothetical protein